MKKWIVRWHHAGYSEFREFKHESYAKTYARKLRIRFYRVKVTEKWQSQDGSLWDTERKATFWNENLERNNG